MGFNFSFFGKQEVRKFSYKPRFYDPETEERRKKFGDFTKPKSEYTPGQHLRGSMRDGNSSQTKDLSGNQKFLGAMSLILLFVVIFLLWKYFPVLLDSLKMEEQKKEVRYVDPETEDQFQIVTLK